MRKVLVSGAVTLLVTGTLGSASSGALDEIMRRSKPLVVAYDARSGRQQWRLPADAPGHASVRAATANRVFVQRSRCLSLDRDDPGDRSELVALDARTGEVAWSRGGVSWRRSAPADGYWDPEGIDATARVIPIEDTANGVLLGLDAGSGRERWRVGTDGLAPVAATLDAIVTASILDWSNGITPVASDFHVRVIDADSGRTRWDRSVALGSIGVKVVAGPTAVVVLSLPIFVGGPAFVEVLDFRTGATIAQAPFEAPGVNVYNFAVTADVIAVGGFTGGGPTRTVGLAATTGAARWTVDGLFTFDDPANPSVLYGSLYGSDPDWQVRAQQTPRVGKLDTRTGALIWEAESPGYVVGLARGTVVVAKGQEYDGSYSVIDALAGLDPDHGKVRWNIVPGPNKSRGSERHFASIYTVSSFVGPSGATVSGGCALTTLN